jgi:hypothetical protein
VGEVNVVEHHIPQGGDVPVSARPGLVSRRIKQSFDLPERFALDPDHAEQGAYDLYSLLVHEIRAPVAVVLVTVRWVPARHDLARARQHAPTLYHGLDQVVALELAENRHHAVEHPPRRGGVGLSVEAHYVHPGELHLQHQ